jgi:hypothetical protein
MMSVYDQMGDDARTHDLRDQLARAEAIITQAIGDADAELMAQGEICTECGTRLATRQGQPTACTECGGTTPPWPPRPPAVALAITRPGTWFHLSDGTYVANEGDRRQRQRILDERAARYALRVARYFARLAVRLAA